MRDGSDAIADWPILNALLNTAAGATWVSVHHGGGVGIGNSLHAGQVIVAEGTAAAGQRLERVLTNDPGIGVARHADAGYDIALRTAEEALFDMVISTGAQNDLERATEIAEDALRIKKETERLKDDLTSMVVHDLKNPVNGIAMMVQLALRKSE